MPAINWNIVATSAATAIIVTLAIEYFAKPRLEARKERILDLLRARREPPPGTSAAGASG